MGNIDPRKVIRMDFFEACNHHPVLNHVRQLWLKTHEISFEQALISVVLILAKENSSLMSDLKDMKARHTEIP